MPIGPVSGYRTGTSSLVRRILWWSETASRRSTPVFRPALNFGRMAVTRSYAACIAHGLPFVERLRNTSFMPRVVETAAQSLDRTDPSQDAPEDGLRRMIPRSRATVTAAVRSSTPSLAKIWRRWVLTVASLM